MYPFPRQLAALTSLIAVAAVVAAGFVASVGEWPSGTAMLVFSGLVLFSAHREVQFSDDDVRLSPSFMVCMASVVVFTAEQALLGVIVVGALSNVGFSHFKKGVWGWLPFNMGVASLAFLAAAATYDALPDNLYDSMPQAFLGVLAAVLAYLAVTFSLLVLSYVVEGAKPGVEVLRELVPRGLETVPFAILGFLLGRLYLDLGAAVMLLIIVPILIAREMFASYLKVKEAHDETVQMLIRALETKDQYTAGHSGRVAKYAQYMGEEFNFGPSRMERLRFAALMHDIGKLVVPNHLLNKPGKLTEEEFARIRLHEGVSVQMLSNIEFLRPIAATAHSDSMRFDPDDADHPVEPYMVMIADAYDAMTSTRSYRKALTQEVAFQELRDKAGTQFHPECVEALIRAIEKRGEVHGAGHEVQSEFENAPEAGLGSAGLGDLLTSEKK